MATLSAVQQMQVARIWAEAVFVVPGITANFNLNQIAAAVLAVDNAFDTTLANAVIAVGGNTTIANGLSSQITASMAGATAAQQTLVVCYTLMKRAGII